MNWAAVRPGVLLQPPGVFPERALGLCVPLAARAETEVRPGTPGRRGSPECPLRPRCFSMPP